MDNVFKIINYLPSTITTRKAIEVFEYNLIDSVNNKIIFDFEDIDFISRAFADEFIHFINNQKIDALIINENTNIKAILEAVQRNRSERNNPWHNIAITHFEDREKLNHLLSLI
jgi:hypothetical protein